MTNIHENWWEWLYLAMEHVHSDYRWTRIDEIRNSGYVIFDSEELMPVLDQSSLNLVCRDNLFAAYLCYRKLHRDLWTQLKMAPAAILDFENTTPFLNRVQVMANHHQTWYLHGGNGRPFAYHNSDFGKHVSKNSRLRLRLSQIWIPAVDWPHIAVVYMSSFRMHNL